MNEEFGHPSVLGQTCPGKSKKVFDKAPITVGGKPHIHVRFVNGFAGASRRFVNAISWGSWAILVRYAFA